jgi:cytochrome c
MARGRRAGAPLKENHRLTRSKKMRILVIVAVGLAVSSAAASAQDVSAGETSFKKCQACHDIGPDAKNKIGPVLNGLDGRKSGTVEGYSYSDADKNANIVWSEATFKEYIQDPRAKIPGTKMFFPGIKNEKEIGDLWAYLKLFKADGSTK